MRWNGLTHAIAGVLVLAFAPIPGRLEPNRPRFWLRRWRRLHRDRAWRLRGLLPAPTPSEKAWQDYNKRKVPMPGHEFSWRLAPAISRRGAGLSFGATF